MSLIQEALRRKEEEDKGNLCPPPRVTTPFSDASPQPSAASPSAPVSAPRKSSKAWLVLAASLLVVLGLMTAAIALIFYSLNSMKTKDGQGAAISTMWRGRSGDPVAAAQPEKPAAAAAPDEPAQVAAIKGSAPVAAASGEVASPVHAAEPASAPVSVASEAKGNVPAAPDGPAPAAPSSETTGERTLWPTLRVVGTLARNDPSEGSAIINGRLMDVGESMDQVVLVEVFQTGVTFGYRGDTKFVKVGQTTREAD